jgi:transcriptional regulator with XRE-family HTH domain
VWIRQDKHMSWERLGREVARRRGQLQLTQAELAQRGGFSVPTLNAIENNRAGRLSKRLRRALEQAIEWEPGSVDAVLDGQEPRVAIARASGMRDELGGDPEKLAAQRFAVVQRLLRMRRAFVEHRNEMPDAVREAMQEEVTAATRETEEALIWMLPWLGEAERGEAIRILAELQQS